MSLIMSIPFIVYENSLETLVLLFSKSWVEFTSENIQFGVFFVGRLLLLLSFCNFLWICLSCLYTLGFHFRTSHVSLAIYPFALEFPGAWEHNCSLRVFNLFVCFWDRVPLCSPHWTRTCYIDEHVLSRSFCCCLQSAMIVPLCLVGIELQNIP